MMQFPEFVKEFEVLDDDFGQTWPVTFVDQLADSRAWTWDVLLSNYLGGCNQVVLDMCDIEHELFQRPVNIFLILPFLRPNHHYLPFVVSFTLLLRVFFTASR